MFVPYDGSVLGLASSSVALLDVVNAVVEKALLPLAFLIVATQPLPRPVGVHASAVGARCSRTEGGFDHCRKDSGHL
jgi:hypothetical protein